LKYLSGSIKHAPSGAGFLIAGVMPRLVVLT